MWYKVVNGKQQGDRMGKRKKFGHGQYADTMTRFVTIEQNVSAIRKFYDDALKEHGEEITRRFLIEFYIHI